MTLFIIFSVVLPFGLLYRSTGNFGSMPPVLAKAPLAFVIGKHYIISEQSKNKDDNIHKSEPLKR